MAAVGPAILVACDPTLGRALHRLFAYLRPGWRVIVTEGAAEARAQLEQRRIDLVLAEISPYATFGLEVLRHARQRAPGVVRVACWGNLLPEDAEVRRADVQLPCPLALHEVLAALDVALDPGAARVPSAPALDEPAA